MLLKSGMQEIVYHISNKQNGERRDLVSQLPLDGMPILAYGLLLTVFLGRLEPILQRQGTDDRLK